MQSDLEILNGLQDHILKNSHCHRQWLDSGRALDGTPCAIFYLNNHFATGASPNLPIKHTYAFLKRNHLGGPQGGIIYLFSTKKRTTHLLTQISRAIAHLEEHHGVEETTIDPEKIEQGTEIPAEVEVPTEVEESPTPSEAVESCIAQS